MKTKAELENFESTYAMLMRSEERNRSASEIVAYVLLIVSAFFSMWQITRQPFTVPQNLDRSSARIAAVQNAA